MSPGNERGGELGNELGARSAEQFPYLGNELGARSAEQFPYLGNYTLTHISPKRKRR